MKRFFYSFGLFLFSFAIHVQILKENTTQDSSGFSKSLIPSIYQLDIEAEGTGAINAYNSLAGAGSGDHHGSYNYLYGSGDGTQYGSHIVT